jgi:hypothetical protein
MEKVKVDKKVSAVELAESGLMVDGLEILPPIQKKTQEQLRHKRKLPYFKIAGRIYYQQSELEKWTETYKIEAMK